MNYPFRTAIINLVNASITTKEFVTNIETVVSAYSEENLMAMFSLLGSHDTERIFTLLKKDVSRLKLAYLLLFTLPGVPSTYYGDEIGLEGGKDPDCRRAFNWNENSWNQDIHRWVKSLIAIRKENPALQKGVITKLVSSEGLFQMVRKNENDQVFICVNPSSEKKKYSPHGEGQTSGLKDLISGKFYSSKEGVYDIEIDPHSGVILVQK
ncbi:MAG: hypothetical protein HGB14_13550 [Anaerolineaceae bacterium]|nr:hypothetical protein [Anaerolineaceae bacterium]